MFFPKWIGCATLGNAASGWVVYTKVLGMPCVAQETRMLKPRHMRRSLALGQTMLARRSGTTT